MNEKPKENPDPVDIPDKRKKEHVRMNAGLILKICLDNEIQPREMILAELEEGGHIDGRAMIIKEIVMEMPDYDLRDRGDFEKAREYLERIFSIKRHTYGQGEVERESEMMSKWLRAGILAYEFIGEGEENNRIIIHVPPTDKAPKLHEIKRSLRDIAEILKQNPNIIEVSGSSLLLAHPLTRSLGFVVQKDSKNKFDLTFSMSREDFIKRWG